jgi:hypothetical protein
VHIEGGLNIAPEAAAGPRDVHQHDVPITMMGHRLSGSTCFHLGEFLASRAHLEQALARFDPAHRLFYISFHIQDPLVPLLNYLSFDLICLGYLDQARVRSKAAI